MCSNVATLFNIAYNSLMFLIHLFTTPPLRTTSTFSFIYYIYNHVFFREFYPPVTNATNVSLLPGATRPPIGRRRRAT